jgi:hypothetical protein
LNSRPLSADAAQTRTSVFKEHEQPKLKALSLEPFAIGRWQRFKLGSNYHISIDGVAYSAPFGLIGKPVDVHYTASLVGIFHQGERVASHPRSRDWAMIDLTAAQRRDLMEIIDDRHDRGSIILATQIPVDR